MVAMESQLLNKPKVETVGTATIEVIYGSQTGNTEGVAHNFQAAAAARGITANVMDLNEFGVRRLTEASVVVVLCSTYNEGNEGDMPDNAVLFWRDLVAEDAPRLDHLRFSVLALGDDGYFDFCHAGQLIDERLAELGAERITERVDCDMYFEDPAEEWTARLVGLLAAALPVSGVVPATTATSAGPVWDRRNPFSARLVARRTLSKAGSQKDVRHYEFDLTGSGITYSAGDSVAIQPVNDPALVDLLVTRLGFAPDAVVDGRSLRECLLDAWEIRTPSFELIDTINDQDPEGELARASEDRVQLEQWLYGRDILDLLEGSPDVKFGLNDLTRIFRPLQARQFSIASGPSVNPNSVELTVATVRHGQERVHGGVATTFLADRVDIGDVIKLYPQPNSAFSLPAEDDTPLIMIGPGTGIAPFRGFLQERQARRASGRSWLFFGDRSRSTDFLYEDEIGAWLSDSTLTRVDLAFSRDQEQKEYVQTRMLENGAELFSWIECGAHIYICGDAERMAKDVEAALLTIIEEHDAHDGRSAEAYLEELILAKRYLRDVY
ncbi:sulfite reductase flavoprotein subunit alpha [Arthrobacter sp. W4I7]|uniref:diflavin oxidoreductase n=1 Tax=Arthrobacter sp. W4I7 TaxID=3042296 RepID=UPI002782F228|nr:flavodoxin domain-containing protein [Arthrobacter sp. W4I7]MDQ0691335.1 sulfite reductase (NADPH) flavoprotein alpha-component [Arthrobacter sp. W4I7]